MKNLRPSLFLVMVLGLLEALCGRVWAENCMVGYWRLDEGSDSIAYDSANGNHGTIYGASWVTGQVGKALDFNGNGDYVNVGNGSDLTSLTPAGMTIEAWVYNTRAIGAGVTDLRTIVGQRDQNLTKGYGLQYGYIGGYSIDDYCVTIVFFGGAQGVASGEKCEILPNQWHHIVSVFDNNVATIYVNGVAQPTWMRNTNANRPSTDDVMIGRHGNWKPGPRPDYHEGIIDELVIYNCALTSEEIEEHYERGLAIQVEIGIKPRTLNLAGKGVLSVFIELPEGYGEEDVDLSTVECEKAPAVKATMADDNELIIKFDREDLVGVSPGDAVELTVTGSFTDGTFFTGTDTVKVTVRGGKK
jgi:hypothetical protein